MNNRPDVACYYPAPYWMLCESDWVKSLLLFFDQIVILLSDYMYGRHVVADPTLVGHMEDRGLLQVLEPKEWFDEENRKQYKNPRSSVCYGRMQVQCGDNTG